MDDALLAVEALGKKYSRSLNSAMRTGARQLLRSYFGKDSRDEVLRDDEFWAVKNISFSLRRGEVLGIIGHNGAGKSTLLKCIAGKLKHDHGSIHMKGSLGHLLEMSAGFEPALSGRQNVELRGRLMGLSAKKLIDYLDEVRDFADIGDFYEAPIQFYSSGMKARLGFAASSCIHPDILIIDEVLAVGDLGFRLKCYERINEMSHTAAVLFVSHSLGQINRICNRAIYLEKGCSLHNGDVQTAIALYQERTNAYNQKRNDHVLNAELVNLTVYGAGAEMQPGAALRYGDSLILEIDVSRLPIGAQLRVMLRDAGSGLLMDWNSARSNFNWMDGANTARADLGPAELNPGAYALALQVMSPDGRDHLCLSRAFPFRVDGELMFQNSVQKRANWQFVRE